jgi:phage terminase large subunit
LSTEELQAARGVLTADEYAQEFECSFQESVQGAIYGAELDAARAAGHVAIVPHEPKLPVDTDWDLGVGDATAIWFSQSLRPGEIRLIDYYEASGQRAAANRRTEVASIGSVPSSVNLPLLTQRS